MRATQQLKYAIYGVFDLAYHGGSGPISLSEIGERQAIPSRYLEQIFQRLRRAGLVESKRGPGGGYQLARPAEEITLADVVVAVQGCVLGVPDPTPCDAQPDFLWSRLQDGLERALRAQSFAELCREAAARGVDRVDAEQLSYEI